MFKKVLVTKYKTNSLKRCNAHYSLKDVIHIWVISHKCQSIALYHPLVSVLKSLIRPGLGIFKNYHMADLPNFASFNTDYIWFERKLCLNPLVWLTVSLALGYVYPCWLNTKTSSQLSITFPLFKKCFHVMISSWKLHVTKGPWPLF